MEKHEIYTSIETAKLLKEAGFDWEITTYYHRDWEGEYEPTPTEDFSIINHTQNLNWNDDEKFSLVPDGQYKGMLNIVSAPSIAMASKWLREVKHIFVFAVAFYAPNEGGWVFATNIRNIPSSGDVEISPFSTYEQAIEAGVNRALLAILKKKLK
jgi:hypothetical protein